MLPIKYMEEIQGAFIRGILAPRVAGAQLTLTDYRVAHTKKMAQMRATPHTSTHQLHMELNHGSWVVPCPECTSGVTTGNRWNEARCFGCGAVFDGVQWPKDKMAIEKVVMKRPLKNRNWVPGEEVAHLIAENVEHGLFEDLRPQIVDKDIRKQLQGRDLRRLMGGK